MIASDFPDNFNIENLREDFIVENKSNVYRMALNDLGSFPHFAVAYYNKSTGELLRSAMTEKGFDKLTLVLNKVSPGLPLESEIALSPAMLNAAQEILNRRINLIPYEDLFYIPVDDDEKENLDRMNHFLQLALPYYNEGKTIDIKQMSNATGLDEQSVQSLWAYLEKGSINKIS